MRIKLDENLSRQLKTGLADLGHDVETAADEDLLGQPDDAIAEAVLREGRMLFTLDLDFSDIRKYTPGTHPGIVLFRPSTYGPLEVNRFVLKFTASQDLTHFAQCVVVVDADRIRIRKP